MNAAKKHAIAFGGMLDIIKKTPTIELTAVPVFPVQFVPDPIRVAVVQVVETDTQIARRLGLKKGQTIRMPDDKDGQPVRKKIKNVDGNGFVTFAGSREKFLARNFLQR